MTVVDPRVCIMSLIWGLHGACFWLWLILAAVPTSGTLCCPSYSECIRFHGKYVLGKTDLEARYEELVFVLTIDG